MCSLFYVVIILKKLRNNCNHSTIKTLKCINYLLKNELVFSLKLSIVVVKQFLVDIYPQYLVIHIMCISIYGFPKNVLLIYI